MIISSYRGAQTGGVSSPEPHTETLLELGLEPGFPPPSLFLCLWDAGNSAWRLAESLWAVGSTVVADGLLAPNKGLDSASQERRTLKADSQVL